MTIFSVDTIYNYDNYKIKSKLFDKSEGSMGSYICIFQNGIEEQISDVFHIDIITDMLSNILNAISMGYDIVIRGDELDFLCYGNVKETIKCK